MSSNTSVSAGDRLPLTCSRSGTCCHDKMVWLNPWELSCLAHAKGIVAREFRDRFCEFGGIRLRFDGPPGWQGLPACSQFIPGAGCSVHPGRPLACRLYPLGRQRSVLLGNGRSRRCRGSTSSSSSVDLRISVIVVIHGLPPSPPE
jgi:uncharacterized protein